MMETGPIKGTIAACAASRGHVLRECLLLGLVLYGAVRTSEARAGDQSPGTAAASMFPAAFVPVRPLTDVEVFSATEFRPRKHSLVDMDPSIGRSVIDAPMQRGGTLSQQMAEFRTESRLRLLTLWQTRGSSLSLQAGKRGAPSLQWSTPWAHRDSASRGLFDRLLIAPARSGGPNARSNIPHATAGAPQSKVLDLSANVRAK